MTTLPDPCAAGRLSVLLEEYRTLRTEVTGRIAGRFTLTGIVIAASALVIAKEVPDDSKLPIGAAVVVLVGVIWAWSWKLVKDLRTHLKVLEERINYEAKQAYGQTTHATKNLLTWESKQ